LQNLQEALANGQGLPGLSRNSSGGEIKIALLAVA